MEGLVKFREAFAEYSENYVVIGGAAWKSHSTLPLLATQNYPFWLKYD